MQTSNETNVSVKTTITN